MILEKYSNNCFSEWDTFINESLNGSFLHTRQFYSHDPRNEIEDCSLIFRNKKIVGVFPAILNDNIVHSHGRSTFGGLIIKDQSSTLDVISMLDLIVNFYRNLNVERILITNPFNLTFKNFNEITSYVLWKKGFIVKYTELEYVIELDLNFTERYHSNVKRNILKAKKNELTVTEDLFLDEFWNVLTQNLEHKYDKKPVHDLNAIKNLIDKVNPNSTKLFCVLSNGIVIGGIFCFIYNERFIHAQYIGVNYDFQELRPLNYLIDYIANWAFNNGFKFFNLGKVSEDFGRGLNVGLMNFKEGFGGKAMVRQTIELVL
jgi:hypothetical protein